MIKVTQLNGKEFFVNPHQIESMEAVPDTVLTMLSGKRLILRETADVVIDRIVEYRRLIGSFGNEE
ncbi:MULTISPECIES: flagellar FlbD family protein [Sediminispirochaeta]|jgi:flagellar protein FlbD|uniref:Flagellar FlbD family protein n=1 Tax=Sediminispirochaeta smaragdinae (strain DSM 11293 / JCM 15392 / SEBR 4228) TaxID=573413 RepID=E1R5T3_SEDSS|nr:MULTISPECIES: flagellar FlbD family protein [Sediminispirochaeta]ADK80698.1 flagellar FlbD family protein [Sediminispirochaeta smaragdinae DSM 11293]